MQLKLTSEKGCGGPFYPEAFSPDTPTTPPPCLQKELKYIVIKLLFTIYRVSQINLTPRQHVPGGGGRGAEGRGGTAVGILQQRMQLSTWGVMISPESLQMLKATEPGKPGSRLHLLVRMGGTFACKKALCH